MDSALISFDNTALAFASHSDAELRNMRRLYQAMRYPLLVRAGTALTPWAIRVGLPIRNLIRTTLFRQFVGGETLDEVARLLPQLEAAGVQAILDYGVEGKSGEEHFEAAFRSVLRALEFAGARQCVPFVSVKLTGMARFALLEKIHAVYGAADPLQGFLPDWALSPAEREEWARVEERLERLASAAAALGKGILVDAEESWIQFPLDALVVGLMRKYNRSRPVIYNTLQLYRTDRLEFMRRILDNARKEGFVAGLKLVRGAYMEKERARAASKGYTSPIQPDKDSCDRDFDAAVALGLKSLKEAALVIATHNEHSNLEATRKMRALGIAACHDRVHFSQLYGMSDHITFNMAAAGYSVSKYLPYGPLDEVVPYLMRRAQENSAVAQQTGRELGLIHREIRRRRRSGNKS